MGKISILKRLTNLHAHRGNASDSSKSFAEKSLGKLLKQSKLLLTVIAVLVSFSLVKGQTASSYTLVPSSGTYVANVTPTATSLAATADEGISTAFNIGFSFTFAGTSYTQVMATSNGALLFGTGRTNTVTNNLATTTTTQRPGVAPLWDDLQCTAGVNYKLTGTSPNQVLTVEWPNMEWNWNSVTAVISFQVKLYEGTNQVQFVYNQNATAVSSGSASIGLMGTASSDFLSLTSSGAAPTTSTSTSTNTISTKPASGQTYTFTPGAIVPPPANDNCAGATAFGTILTDGTCTTLSNRSTASATASGVTPTGACTSTSGTADDDVWFSFVAPGPSVVLSSTFVSGSSDVYWHVFSSACNATMTSILCTDTDAGATLTGLTTGATYYIRLYTWSAAVSTVQNICLRTPPPPPANDNCSGAVNLTVNGITCTTPTSGTTVNATQSQTSCAGTADDDVWFSFVATSASHTVTVTPTTLSDAVLQVFSGSCAGLTSLGCTDGTAGSSNETVSYTTLTPGNTYYARVHSYSSASGNGTFTICVTTPTPPSCVSAPTTPVDGATGVTTSTLSWPAVSGATSYDVFIGVGSLPVTPNATVTTTTYTATLLSNSNYVWKVVPKNSGGDATGCVTWSFTTGLVYCTPASTSSSYFIANFNTTGGISNISNTTTYVTGGYANYTAQSASQYNQNPPGNTVNFSVTGGGSFNTYGIAIWVDWNNDGTFATSERVYNSAAYVASASGSFTVPASQASGSYRMRVMADYFATSPNPCAFSTSGPYGEVEDYTFNVVPVPAPSCVTAPASPADGATGVAVSGTTLTWPAAPYATGYDVYFDEGSSAATLVSPNQAGTSYLIPGTLNSTELHSWSIVPKGVSGDASGCATWSFTTANTPPAQDQCGGAKIISSNAGSSGPTLTGTFTNINCTNTNDPINSCQPASDRGLWWSFTPDVTAAFSFSTCSSVTATTVADNVLGIFTSSDGTCSGTFTQVACNDNAGAACSNSLQSIISNQILTGGTTYYILAYANGSANTGNIQIQVTRSLISPTLTAAPGATVDNQFDITFTSDVNWESSVTDITVGGISLPASAYTVSNGIITLKPSESALLQTSGSKNIEVIATGYTPASVTQQINPGLPANLIVSTQPVAPTVSGGSFATQPRVTVRDQYNNLVLAGITINAQVNPTQTADWSLGGNITATTNASGVAIFSGLTASNLTTAVYTGATIIFTPGSGSGNAQSDPFNLPIPPPAYDICSGAVEIPCDGSVTLDNTYATIDALPSVTCGSTSSTTGTYKGIWLKVTPTVSGSMTVSTCNSVTLPDTYLRIYSGSCSALTTCMGSDDDNCTGATSTVTFTATANITYYVLCGLYDNLEPAGNITVSATCPVPPPANDICSGAVDLSVNGATCATSTSGTTVNTTQSLAGCSGTADDDVWYAFTATAASHVVNVTPGTLYDAVIQVFSGSCSALTSLGCTDATFGSSNEVATLTGLNIGQTYYVRVYSYFSDVEDRGTFSICVTTPPPSITVSPATLAVAGYNEGTGPLGTSASTFTVSGSNLLGDISLSAPADYEIATSASGSFGTSLSFTPTNGTVSATTIYVRLIGGLSIGTYNSEILTATSQDATDKTVTFNSAVYLPNNDCDGATELPCGGTVTDDYNLASDDVLPGVSCGSTTSGVYKGLWYTLSPTVSGSVTVSSCASFGTDTYLRIYEGVCGSFTPCVGFSDDASGACATGGLFSSVTFNATAGTTYYVFSSLYSASSTAGEITLTATCPIAAPVANDITICDDNFTAKWSKVDEAFSYQLDVSTSSTFNTFISGYNNLSVTGTSQLVTVPSIPGTYYYRVRAVRGSVISLNSNTATVQVNSSPEITCPANISVNTTTACGANVDFMASATGIPAPTIDYSTTEGSVASGDFFPVGITTISALASNSCNESSCEFTITVTDAIAPVATCQDVTVQLDASGNGSTTADDIDNGSSDACGISSLSLSKTAFVCTEVGANTETLTVTDENGNVSTCTTTITVVDGVAPFANCQDITVQLDASGNGLTTADDVNNGSSDACGIASLSLSQTAFVCSEVGANTETLTVTDVNGNASTCTTTITVQDNVAPIATCQDVTVQLDASGNGSTTADDINNGSSDACGIAGLSLSQTAFVCSEVGANTETLTVTDVNGNVSTCTTTITVEDNVAPVATCQDVTVQLDATGNGSTTADDVNNGSSDACGIASLSLSQVNFSCSEVGTNTETLTVTDVNGNESTCTATITVVDGIAPVAVCKDITIDLTAGGSAVITASSVNNGSSDACGIASLSVTQTAFNCSEVGPNEEVLTVTDVNGNISTCTTIVTVEDNVAPQSLCQNVTVHLDASGYGSTTPQAVNNGSTDACGLLPQCMPHGPMVTCLSGLSLDKATFNCGNIGANTVILTATDNHYNSATCEAIVTVVDDIAPVALCQNVTVQLNASGTGSTDAASVNNGSSDACGIGSLTLNKTAFNCGDVGTKTVTLTVVDVNGNISSCNSTVTIQDNVAPTAVCKNVTLTLTGGSATITASSINNGSSDACGIASLVASPTVFGCSNIGGNTATLTVTDVNGNVSTCTSTVTINGVVPSCSIASVPTSTVYTGGNNNVIYLGYGAQSTRLVASVTGGSGFTYSWTGSNLSSNSVSNPIFTPTAPGTYNFSVTITNSNGCVTSCTITICVVDIRVPGTGGKKVFVCHTESSSPHTLQISVNGVAAHLAHGDYLGSCGTSTVCNPRPFTKDQSGSQSVAKEITTETVTVTEKSIVNEVKVNAYPNPFKYNTTIAFTLPEASENVTLSVFNIEGREVKQLYNGPAKGQQEYQFQLNVTDEMQSGLYFYRLQTKEGKVVVNKLIFTK